MAPTVADAEIDTASAGVERAERRQPYQAGPRDGDTACSAVTVVGRHNRVRIEERASGGCPSKVAGGEGLAQRSASTSTGIPIDARLCYHRSDGIGYSGVTMPPKPPPQKPPEPLPDRLPELRIKIPPKDQPEPLPKRPPPPVVEPPPPVSRVGG